jgi:RNA polymerase sigma-70 factor (ECF subfamily)
MGPQEIQKLYEDYGFVVYGRCMRILANEDDARDAMQTVFQKLVQHQERLRNRESVLPWIFTTARNHCFNILRARRRDRGVVDPELLAHAGNLEERLSAREIISLVMREQSRKVRDAVYYTYVEKLGQRDIQQVTGQSPATVRRNLERFRKHVTSMRKRLSV